VVDVSFIFMLLDALMLGWPCRFKHTRRSIGVKNIDQHQESLDFLLDLKGERPRQDEPHVSIFKHVSKQPGRMFFQIRAGLLPEDKTLECHLRASEAEVRILPRRYANPVDFESQPLITTIWAVPTDANAAS